MSGFGSNLVEDDRVVEVLERSLGEAGRDDARVGHEQGTRHAQLAQRLAQPADRSRSVDESRRHLDRADGFDFDGHSCSSLGGRRRSREVPLAPVLGVGDVVEREDMEAGDPALRSASPASIPSTSGSGLESSRPHGVVHQLRWRRRKRIEAPSPIEVETRMSFVRGTAPGMPM